MKNSAKNKNTRMDYVYRLMKSPIGVLKLVGNDKGLAAILWEKENPRRAPLNIAGEDKKHPVLVETEKQLNEYFAKKRSLDSMCKKQGAEQKSKAQISLETAR